MNGFREISPYETENALKLIGKDWMLITARDGEKVNAMTASWGCMGVLWNKAVAVVFIRPQRHTYGLIENSDRVSLAFLGDEYREALTLCGRKSGRDCDKLALAGLSSSACDGVDVINEASLLLVCKKLYRDELKADGFLDGALLDNYKNGDFHKVYVLEIEKAMIKDV